MVVATKERKKRASFDELLMAGVRAIAERGIDHVSVSDVAKLSQVSRPTFYTYFGDMSGFFAEIWLRFGREWLEAQIDKKSEIAEVLDQALLEIVAVSRRIPEVYEVLQPDFEKWWQERAKGSELESQLMVWELGFLLGYKLSSKVTPKSALGLPIRELMNVPDNVLDLPGMEGLGVKITKDMLPPMNGLGRLDDSVESILTQAAIEVIATSGVAASSMTRIARRARVSTGSVYPRFKSSEALIHHSFSTAIKTIVAKNMEMVTEQGIGIDIYAMTVNAGYGENRKIWRHFRTEMHVEAAHDKELAKFMESGFEASSQFLVDNFLKFGAPADFAKSVAWFLHSHAIGISIIHSFLPEIEQHDNRIMGRWIIRGLQNPSTAR
jgi:AcrR family transcriptional regulator